MIEGATVVLASVTWRREDAPMNMDVLLAGLVRNVTRVINTGGFNFECVLSYSSIDCSLQYLSMVKLINWTG